ncbi:GTP cyclohydrolase 1 type 2/Nif3 [Limtongia smithiae]|uniref:GTP cyclohydrolase 1 type 2/Nif3 n=1 Tax=Limtongia smithiae TaxID=1125753 RepID=UPI0034CEBCCC
MRLGRSTTHIYRHQPVVSVNKMSKPSALTITSTTKALKSLIATVQQLYPPGIADKTWDNTGLLLESPVLAPPATKHARVMLTIDLTTAVVDEALTKRPLLIVAYHPIIFRPVKSLTQSNTQQRSLLRLAQAGISVYSPHTAVDAQVGGMNDWLADVITGTSTAAINNGISTKVIEPTGGDEYAPTGFGRLVASEKSALTLATAIANVKAGLGLKHVQVALAEHHKDINSSIIHSIAICAGSGASVLSKTHADLWFTGELSHHEILALVERGTSAIICGHTNTERGYLTSTFAPNLLAQIASNVNSLDGNYYDGFTIDVVVSEADRDPVTTF